MEKHAKWLKRRRLSRWKSYFDQILGEFLCVALIFRLTDQDKHGCQEELVKCLLLLTDSQNQGQHYSSHMWMTYRPSRSHVSLALLPPRTNSLKTHTLHWSQGLNESVRIPLLTAHKTSCVRRYEDHPRSFPVQNLDFVLLNTLLL